MLELDEFDRLCQPFPVEIVKFRVGSYSKDKTKGKAFVYVDARDVMDKLDSAVGPDGWSSEFSTVAGYACCTITLHLDGGDVRKSDGAGQTNVEGEKGQFSDAFKRAAVHFGVGRYLYDFPVVWVGLDSYKQIMESELPTLHDAYQRLVNRSEWGSRDEVGSFRLLEGQVKSFTPEQARDFVSANKGMLENLNVGPKRKLFDIINGITEGEL